MFFAEYQVAEHILVCGSGPSLDESIEDVRELANTHLVIAAASSYGTLVKNNIIPDILCILERGQFLYDDYLKCVTETSSQKTILVTSSVCDYKLAQLFQKRIVFFRPSLTPLYLFNSTISVLTIRWSSSRKYSCFFSSCLTNIALIGCDLGTLNLDKVRSGSAAGVSPRTLIDKFPQILVEIVGLTHMQDAILQHWSLISSPQNILIHNGALIKMLSLCIPMIIV